MTDVRTPKLISLARQISSEVAGYFLSMNLDNGNRVIDLCQQIAINCYDRSITLQIHTDLVKIWVGELAVFFPNETVLSWIPLAVELDMEAKDIARGDRSLLGKDKVLIEKSDEVCPTCGEHHPCKCDTNYDKYITVKTAKLEEDKCVVCGRGKLGKSSKDRAFMKIEDMITDMQNKLGTIKDNLNELR